MPAFWTSQNRGHGIIKDICSWDAKGHPSTHGIKVGICSWDQSGCLLIESEWESVHEIIVDTASGLIMASAPVILGVIISCDYIGYLLMGS